MNVRTMMLLTAAMFYSIAAHAHDCTGGAGGGMDATGNQCNAEFFVSTDAATTTPTVVSQLSTGANDSHSSHAMVRSNSHSKNKSVRHAKAKHSVRGLT